MKRTENCGVAHELEAVQATAYEPYADRRIYVVDGHPGFFRRLAVPKAGQPWPDGSVRALLAGRLVCLVGDPAIDAEMREALLLFHRALDDSVPTFFPPPSSDGGPGRREEPDPAADGPDEPPDGQAGVF